MSVLTMSPTMGDLLKYELNPNVQREVVTIKQGAALALGTVLGRLTKDTVAVAAGGANAGSGTMLATPTLGAEAEAGAYLLTVTGTGTVPDTAEVTPGGSNTGDGTLGAIAVGAQAMVGNYVLTITSKGPGVAAAGTSAAGAGNAGDGTITASPATGAGAKAGVYRITCIEPATDGGTFQVEDPDGIAIGVAPVGVEFTTHLTFTIADGSTDFAAGDTFTITVAAADSGTFSLRAPNGLYLPDGTVAVAYSSQHLSFTLADGGTDFEVGDVFTIAVSQADAGVFTLRTPSGLYLPEGSVGVAYSSLHLSFTLQDGATDFAAGDTFTITVSGSGKYVAAPAASVDGSDVAAGVLLFAADASAGDVTDAVVLARGPAIVSRDALVFDASVDDTAKKAVKHGQLAALGIQVRETA